jgi:hypothetical protein
MKPRPPVNSYVLGPDILLSTLFPNILKSGSKFHILTKQQIILQLSIF